MVHPVFRADVPRRGGVTGIAGDDVGEEGIVQVRSGAEGVKGSLGKGSFGSSSGGGRRLAGEAADEIHEEFRQFLVVDGAVDRQGSDTVGVIRGVVPPSPEDGVHRHEEGSPAGDHAKQRLPTSDMYFNVGSTISGRVCRYRGFFEGFPLTMRGWDGAMK